jgi:hypothetical protein
VSDHHEGETCLPPELIVKNTSVYTINELYMHDSFEYSSGELVASNVPSDGDITVAVSDGLVKYFTFIRNITSTSSVEIAVTTAEPIAFNECYKYTLNLLPEDFFLQESDNYEAPESTDKETADINKEY